MIYTQIFSILYYFFMRKVTKMYGKPSTLMILCYTCVHTIWAKRNIFYKSIAYQSSSFFSIWYVTKGDVKIESRNCMHQTPTYRSNQQLKWKNIHYLKNWYLLQFLPIKKSNCICFLKNCFSEFITSLTILKIFYKLSASNSFLFQ